MDSGHSVSDKLEPDKEKFCVVQGSGQWWVSNIVQQNFGQLYVRCWPKYDLTGIWGWTNVLYDLKLRRFCLGVALKTNTWGLVLAGSREAERITSQIEQGQWTKKQQRKGSVTFNIFLSSQFDFCPEINISTFQLNYFPKKWRTGVVQLSHATAIASQGRKTPYLYNLTVSSIMFTQLLYRVWVEPVTH